MATDRGGDRAVWWLGYRVAPGIFLGAFPRQFVDAFAAPRGAARWPSRPASPPAYLEAVTAVYLLHRFVGVPKPFQSRRRFFEIRFSRAAREHEP